METKPDEDTILLCRYSQSIKFLEAIEKAAGAEPAFNPTSNNKQNNRH